MMGDDELRSRDGFYVLSHEEQEEYTGALIQAAFTRCPERAVYLGRLLDVAKWTLDKEEFDWLMRQPLLGDPPEPDETDRANLGQAQATLQMIIDRHRGAS